MLLGKDRETDRQKLIEECELKEDLKAQHVGSDAAKEASNTFGGELL